MRLKISIAIIASAFSLTTQAQQQQNVAGCSDKAVHAQLVSIDQTLEQQGFNLVQFKLMSMPSGSYVPVEMEMEQGKMYQINFIASKNYQQYTFTILDKDRKKVVDKKVKQKDGLNNQFTESFAAPYTGSYIIVLTQKVKGQDEACGGFSVLKAVNDHLPATAPAAGSKK
jgi:hypothetical protein